jgi:hypothetical protein
MKPITVKHMSAVGVALALIAGVALIVHGSGSFGVFSLPSLNLTQARAIYLVGLIQTVLGVAAFVVAFMCYRAYNRQF